jgi:hypothetical protein
MVTNLRHHAADRVGCDVYKNKHALQQIFLPEAVATALGSVLRRGWRNDFYFQFILGPPACRDELKFIIG